MKVLLRWVSVRHLRDSPVRTALTLLGVALGVAVFVAIRIANHSAMASFSDTVDAVAGRANLEVAGGTEGFDERAFLAARAMHGVRAAAPLVEVGALARAGGPAPASLDGAAARAAYDESVEVLGVDPFAETPFARYRAEARPGRAARLAFLADPRAVAVTRAFAERHGARLGDPVTLLAAGRPVTLVVREIIDSQEFQQAFGGNVLVTDIATAQEVFGRVGTLDRIDLIVDPARRDAIAAALRRVLPAAAEVTTPRVRTRQVENMVRAFRLNLTALSFIAVFVSAFLIFNAVGAAVLRRRGEIGILRGLGLGRRAVAALFLIEGLGFGVAGSGLGLGLGVLLARATLHAVSRTLGDLYLVAHAGTLRTDPLSLLLGFGLGVGVSVLSALAPALEAAATPPVTALREGMRIDARRVPVAPLAGAGLVLIAAAAAVAVWTVREHRPAGGFASAALLLTGCSLVAPAFTLAAGALGAPVARRLGGIEAVLGLRFMRESVARTSVVVASIMVSVGMMVALSIMVGSFRDTVSTWVRQTIRGDLYVEPVGHRMNGSAAALPPAFVAATRALPGVRAVDSYRGGRTVVDGAIAWIAGVDFDVQARYGHLQFVHGESRALLMRARAIDGALVTESFARRHRVGAGGRVRLATAAGMVSLPVVGVFYDYSTDAGAVFVDRALYARLWRDPRTESLALYLAPGASVDTVRRALTAAAGPGLVLSMMPNRALRERVLVVFDQTFQITYALQAIAILVAVLGVVTTLTALILQRARDLAMLRAAGALRAQVRRMVLVESGALGVIGALLGCLGGVALALVLVHVINREYFGWTIRMTVDPWIFAQAIGLMGVAAVLAGIGPARFAATRAAAAAMRAE